MLDRIALGPFSRETAQLHLEFSTAMDDRLCETRLLPSAHLSTYFGQRFVNPDSNLLGGS